MPLDGQRAQRFGLRSWANRRRSPEQWAARQSFTPIRRLFSAANLPGIMGAAPDPILDPQTDHDDFGGPSASSDGGPLGGEAGADDDAIPKIQNIRVPQDHLDHGVAGD